MPNAWRRRRQRCSPRSKERQLQARPLHQGGGCHSTMVARGYSHAPRAEKAPLMTTETTAQHEEGNFKMAAKNFNLTEPRETRATAMNRADVYRELYNAAEFHLFGAGHRPAKMPNARWRGRQWGTNREQERQLQARPLYQGGGCHPPVATRGYSYAPRPEEAPRMTIETTVQHKDGNF